LNPLHLNSLQRLTALGQKGNQDLSGRRVMAEVGLKLVVAKPILGFGPGALAPAFVASQGELLKDPAYATEPYRYTADLHQDFLQMAASAGLPSLLAFLGLFLWALFRAWEARRFAVMAALVSLALDACFHFPLEVVPSAALFWTFLGWAESPLQKAEAPASRAERLLPPFLALLSLFVFGRLIQASALLHQGMDLSLDGESAVATPLLEASLAIHDDERAWMRLGLDRDVLGDENGASNAFCRCEDIPEGLANEALAQAKLGHLEQGRELSRRSLALNPKNLEAWGNLGKIDYLSGLSPAAEADYREALTLDPSWAAGYFNLGAMEINERRPAAAKLDLQAYLRLEPGDAQATALLRRLP
jgi:tetratricopeptide (TPR) repeat protein